MKAYLSLLFVIFVFNINSFSQAALTGEDVLNIFIDSLGGEQNLKNVKTTIMEMEGQIYDQKFSTKSYRVFPDKMKVVIKGPLEESIRILNGKKGVIFTNGKKMEMDDLTKMGMIEEAKIFPDLYYIENGWEAINHGEKNYEKGYYEVELIQPNGNKRINYYSIDTGLLFKSIDGETNSTSYYNNYENFGEIKIPTKLKLRSEGGVIEFTLVNYEANVSIDNTIFNIE